MSFQSKLMGGSARRAPRVERSTSSAWPAIRSRPAESPTLLPRAARLLSLFGISPRLDDPRLLALHEATMHSDPVGDGVAAFIMRSPSGQGRRQFEQALEHGLDSLPNPPAELRALFSEIEVTPAWLDRALVAEGADAMVRQGAEGLCALSGVSLMGGYLSTGATRPLVATGALSRMAPRRLAETTQFVHAIATSGGMLRDSNGFKTTVRVRVMHALVRAQLLASPSWQSERWGLPINQRDMVGTHLTFTVMFVSGAFALGRLISAREREAMIHQWRYVSFLLGTPDALLPKSYREAVELGALFNISEAGPDQECKALAAALVDAWGYGGDADRPLSQRLFGSFMVGYSRYALGKEAADRLQLPDTVWKRVPPALALVRLSSELLRLLFPNMKAGSVAAGRQLIDRHLELTMGGQPARFVASAEGHA